MISGKACCLSFHNLSSSRSLSKNIKIQRTIILPVTSLVAWWSELQTTNHEVPGSIPGSTMCVFP